LIAQIQFHLKAPDWVIKKIMTQEEPTHVVAVGFWIIVLHGGADCHNSAINPNSTGLKTSCRAIEIEFTINI
jgi:hypothetical protein